MSNCSDCGDAFDLANRNGEAMNVVAVIQHTAGEYLGLMEDHLEGRRIRFQYFRPFAAGKLPAPDLPADALILLGKRAIRTLLGAASGAFHRQARHAFHKGRELMDDADLLDLRSGALVQIR